MSSSGSKQKLAALWATKKFEPVIHHIRFPKFKHLAVGLRIDFQYPITAIVGPNGTNKTSILRALQGCPEGNDLGTYSFGTAMDSFGIGVSRDRFIYGRFSETQGSVVEVVKTRIGRKLRGTKKVDPDLYEPSRPLLNEPDSMDRYPYDKDTAPVDGSATRWRTIEKEVTYVDFRSQLSAFDWAIYHSDSGLKPPFSEAQLQNARKAKVRTWSPPLARAIREGRKSDYRWKTERIISPIRELTEAEVKTVSIILGRKYEAIRVIKHRYFGSHEGWTAVMKFGSLNYSEAFAGSGEFAVIMLVVKLTNAPVKSLILLDEPEVSLHPSAQTRLMEFIEELAATRFHQVVISTHSKEIIANLPDCAVKVLVQRGSADKVDIVGQSSRPHTAFEVLGIDYEKATVVVEDQLAASLVNYALKDTELQSPIQVKFIPGGAGSLLSGFFPVWVDEVRENLLLLLDGDQECDAPPPVEQIPPVDLERVLRESLGGADVKLPFGRGEPGSQPKREELQKRMISWRRKYVRFLPFETPENFLWGHIPAAIQTAVPAEVGENHKRRWLWYAQEKLGLERPSGDQIHTLQVLTLQSIDRSSDEIVAIREMIKAFLDGVPA